MTHGVAALFAASPTRAGKTFLDVGAGKGYTSLELVRRWLPEAGLQPRKLWEYWATAPVPIDASSGGCGQGQAAPLDTAPLYAGGDLGGVADARFWAVEASPDTYDMLLDSPISAARGGPVGFIHAAVTDREGPARFLDCEAAKENCHLAGVGDEKQPTVTVRGVTVDELVSDLLPGGERLSLLASDALGYDPLVLRGAEQSLRAGRIGALRFHYHGIGKWAGGGSHLATFVAHLDELHYTCFMESKARLWVLTGCWQQGFEIFDIAWVFCAHRSEVALLNELYAASNLPDVRAATLELEAPAPVADPPAPRADSITALVNAKRAPEAVDSGGAEADVQAPDALANERYSCSAVERRNVTARFKRFKSSWQLACGGTHGIDAIFAASPSRVGKTFLDIGANKGYAVIEWLWRWLPEAGVTPRKLRDYWREVGKTVKVSGPDGGCGQGQVVPDDTAPLYANDPTLGAATDARMWAVEAAPATYALLGASPLSASRGGPVVVLNAAGSATDGTMQFMDCDATNEGCRAVRPTDVGVVAVDVRAVTVDTLVKELLPGGERLFMLQIDTEGYDPDVLKGAEGSLRAGRVSIVEFEYHGLGRWAGGGETLRRVTDWLDEMHYTCFLESKAMLWVLTGCWQQGFEFFDMSNVVCAHRSEAAVLDELYAASNLPGVRAVREE